MGFTWRSDSTLYFFDYRKLHCAKSARQSVLPSFKVIIIIGFWFAFEKPEALKQRWRTKEITTASTKREKKCSTFRKRYTKRANALKSCVQTIVSSTSRCGVKRGAFLQDMVTNGYLELELLGGWVIHQRRITLLLRQRDITLNFFFHGQFPFLWLVFDFLFILSSVPLETE